MAEEKEGMKQILNVVKNELKECQKVKDELVQ